MGPVDPAAAAGIALVALGLVLTPGPNMLYLVSRSLAQGRRAGLISLVGTGLGFLVYLAGLSLLPQLIDPGQGSVALQALVLGGIQIAIALAVNGLIVILAGSLAVVLARHPAVARAQRWVMGVCLAGFGVKLLTDRAPVTA